MSAEGMPPLPLPEQDGWGVDIGGTLVLFCNNAEKRAGMSQGAEVPVFADAKMHAYGRLVAQECARIAKSAGRPVGASDGDTYIPGTSADAADAICKRFNLEPS